MLGPSILSAKNSRVARVVMPDRWLSPEQFEAVVIQHPFVKHLENGDDIVFEFPATAALPAGLGLWLLSFFNQLADVGTGWLRLEFATREGLFSYLDRNGFLQLLSPVIETNPERPVVSGADVRRGQAPGLVEIAALVPNTPLEEKKAIVERLVNALVGFYPAGERTHRLRNHVFTVLGELVDNVFSHSRTSLPGYASLQAYDKSRRPRVQIGVSDSGLGIPESIRGALGARVARKSDADLVIEAFRSGLSRHGANSGRGCGLVMCARLAADYGSFLHVRTPSAQVILQPAGGQRKAHEATVHEGVGPLRGTHICLEFRVDDA